MLILQGCYTYPAFKPENPDNRYPSAGNPIIVHTTDGHETELSSNHFVVVEKPEWFYYGTGERAEKNSSDYSDFKGKFYPIGREADYVICPTCLSALSQHRLSVFRLPDSSLLRTEEYFIVDSTEGTGIFYDDREWQGSGYVHQTGKIPLSNISFVDVRKFSYLKTILFAIPCSIFAAGMVAAAWLGGSGGQIY